MRLIVGTSGWQYRDWRGTFYPRPAPGDDLAYYASVFRSVEVNNTFYRLPEAETFDEWRERTPPGFVVAVKASRYLTHIKRLREPEDAVRLMMERASRLGDRLGPVLLQLPPQMRRDDARLDAALRAFPPGQRVAVEFRHASWFENGVRSLLARHGAALCIADRGSRLISPAWRTADWGYVRFHEGRARPQPCYGRRALASRARLLRELFPTDEEVYAYFNNDARACAVRDALAFAHIAER